MEKIELKDAFAEFKNQKNIDRPTMMGVLEDVFRTQIAKVYGDADNFDVIINIDKGGERQRRRLRDRRDLREENRDEGLRPQGYSQYQAESSGPNHGPREGQSL